MTGGRPLPVAFEALLDALEADLLVAPAGEVRDTLRETGRSNEGACREVRSVLDAAAAADEGCAPACPPRDLGHQPGLHRPYRH